jgi:hypothetical protein
MLKIRFDGISAHDWKNQFIRFEDQNILQSWVYGDAKGASGSWAVERAFFEKGDSIVGMMQVLIRNAPLLSRGLVWINRGPLWRSDNSDPADLAEMLLLLGAHYADDLGHYVLIAPTAVETIDFESVLAQTNFRQTKKAGWASAILDLTMPLDALRGNLNQKWRNCLNKAERAGYEVRLANSGTVFDDFLQAHAGFHVAKGLTTNLDADFLTRLNAASTKDCELVALVAYHERVPIGSVLVAFYGKTAEYLAGNSTDLGRKLNSGQLLLWRAIELMKIKGLVWFDLGGMDQDLTPDGIFRFKKGVGAEAYRLVGEIEPNKIGNVARLLRWRINQVRAKSLNL